MHPPKRLPKALFQRVWGGPLEDALAACLVWEILPQFRAAERLRAVRRLGSDRRVYAPVVEVGREERVVDGILVGGGLGGVDRRAHRTTGDGTDDEVE
jgi:hypothetical protein